MGFVFTALLTLFATLAAGQSLLIDTPTNVVECQPALLTWSGGTPPYNLSFITIDSPISLKAIALFTTSIVWQSNATAGTSMYLFLQDSTGNTAKTSHFTIMAGSSASCLMYAYLPQSSSASSSASSAPIITRTVTAGTRSYPVDSSSPVVSTSTAASPVITTPTHTTIYWNPNPYPPATAISETFVKSSTTLVIAIPTVTTTVTLANAVLTLGPGGTPIGAPVPPDIFQPGAITPTWNNNVIPPTDASTITFTAPPSFISVVAVPKSNSPPMIVTGPPGNNNNNWNNLWLLSWGPFGPVIIGSLPFNVNIVNGITPVAVPPAVWTGSWSNPAPSPTSDSSSSSSTTFSSFCSAPTSPYTLSDDPENSDWEANGTDPDKRRKRSGTTVLTARAIRHIAVGRCKITIQNNRVVSLRGGTYYSIGPRGGISAVLESYAVERKPRNAGVEVNQEHVFELGYISDFFNSTSLRDLPCDRVQEILNYILPSGTSLGMALLQAIDRTENMVWVDKPMNQAKSNVVNQNTNTPNNFPQRNNIEKISNFTTDASAIQNIEYFIRNLAALGQYLESSSEIFRATALRVQNLLSEVTPATPLNPSLPSLFNTWLQDVVREYPSGCTDRFYNSFAKYKERMAYVAEMTGDMLPPECDQLFYATLMPSGLEWERLVPTAPNLPVCDGPGTTGMLSTGSTFLDDELTVMGSGNTDFFAMGIHSSDISLRANSIQGCDGVYGVALNPPQANLGWLNVTVALDCLGQTGGEVIAPLEFVLDGARIACVNTPFATAGVFAFCASLQSAAQSCLQQVYPNQGTFESSSFKFYPNN